MWEQEKNVVNTWGNTEYPLSRHHLIAVPGASPTVLNVSHPEQNMVNSCSRHKKYCVKYGHIATFVRFSQQANTPQSSR